MTETDSSRDPVEELAEDYLDRLRRGERPALTEYTERRPELADEIRELFPALAKLEELRPRTEDEAIAPLTAGTTSAARLERLGDFRILREIGRGGMGIVYEAEQISLGRHVALKVLPRHAVLDPRRLERFRREAKAAARLHHTNIVPVFGAGEEEGLPYFVMQFIGGLGLDQVLSELRRLRAEHSSPEKGPHQAPGLALTEPDQPVTVEWMAQTLLGDGNGNEQERSPSALNAVTSCEPAAAPAAGDGSTVRLPGQLEGTTPADSGMLYWRSVARVGVQVAEALAYAADQGILHRDIKPSNLLLDARGTVWVTDFGLAKAEADPDDLTQTGDMLGTLRYLAPERLAGRGDIRSDVYSLGLTLYELLTLRPAFDEPDRERLLHRIVHDRPPRPRKLDPAVPRDLETIVVKSSAAEASARYPTARALADDLRRFLADEPIRARPSSLPERGWRWCRRNPALAGLAALVAGLTLAIAVLASVAAVRLKNQRDVARALAGALATREADLRAESARGNRLLYLSDMRLVQRLWDSEDGSARGIDELLTRHGPGTGDADLREFTWRLQWTRLHANADTPPHARGTFFATLREDGRLTGLNRAGVLWEWDTLTRRPLGERDLSGGKPPVGVVLSPDGSIAGLGEGLTMRLVRSATGEELFKAQQSSQIEWVAFSPDNRFVAGLWADREAHVWEVSTGKEVGSVSVRKAPYRSFSVTQDGGSVILSNHPVTGKVTIYRLGGGATTLPVTSGSTVVQTECSPDGRVIAAANYSGIIHLWDWDAVTATVRSQINAHVTPVRRLMFSPDSRSLYSGSLDGSVAVWDVSTGRNLARFKGHMAPVTVLAPSASGPELVTGDNFGTIRTWQSTLDLRVLETAARQSSRRSDLPRRNRVVFSRDGRMLATNLNSVRLWDTRTWKPIHSLKRQAGRAGEAWPACMVFTPDSSLLAVGDSDSVVTLWDVSTGQVVRSLPGIEAAFYGPPSPVYSMATPETKRSVSALAVSPDGTLLAVGYGISGGAVDKYDQRVKVFDLRTGAEMATLRVVNSVAWTSFSSDGSILMAACHDGFLRRWRVRDWEPQASWAARGRFFSAAISPDGRLIAGGHMDGTVEIWESATGRELHLVHGHPGNIESTCFSADSRTLVTVSTSGHGLVKFWDVRSGGELLSLRTDATTTGAAFSPRGDALVMIGPAAARVCEAWPLDRIDAALAADRPVQTRSAAP